MTEKASRKLQIGKWLVEPAAGRVSSDSVEAILRPKEMELLVYLAKRHGEVVSTDEIMSEVWAGVEVTNDSLYFSISQLRKRLDEPGAEQSCIETMPKRGYRLSVPVHTNPAVKSIPAADPTPQSGRAASRDDRWKRDRRVLYGIISAMLLIILAGWFWDKSSPEVPEDDSRLPGSIAVMPLIDLSPETDYTYFSDGITDEILNRLARIRGLQVAARTSSFAFKDNDASVQEIGDALDVATIIEGSVRKDGDTVRVSVQLIDTESGFQLWSETYERELIGVFAIQNDISRNIANALELTLAYGPENSEGGELLASDPRAVDEYLQGLEAVRAMSFDSYRRAIQHFETVLRIDPTFTQALIHLADAKLGLLSTGASYNMSLIDQAEAHVQEALQHDPDSGPAYRILSIVSRWRGQWEQARRQILTAIELAPSDSISMVTLGELYSMNNELDKAGQAFERALRIDPYGSAALVKYTWYNKRVGNIDKARATIERAIDLRPENPNLPWMLGQIQVGELGDLVGGLNSFLSSAALDPQDYEIAAYVAMTYLTLDLPELAGPWIDRAKNDGPDTATSQALEATVLQLSGDKAGATAVSTAAIREPNYRLLFHELLTENLIVIATRNLIDENRADDAIKLFENVLPESAAWLGPGRNIVLDGTIMVMNKFSDSWMIALASLYVERGDLTKASELIKAAAENRLAGDVREKGLFRNDHFLMEARVAAMMGNHEAALDFLEEAISRNFVFAWQIQVANDYAFRNLESEPRFQSMINQLQAEVDRQRLLVLAEPALSSVWAR